MPEPSQSAGIPPVNQQTPPPSEAAAAVTDLQEQLTPSSGKGVGNVRWIILTLIFFATTINYLDRQVLGILAPTLRDEIGWSESEYGLITAAFTYAYAMGLLLFGRFVDRIGTRLGYLVSIVWWSIAAMLHAVARTPLGFGLARFTLGLGESGNFPTAIKAVSEWFPKKERAFATGIFNAGTNVGAVIAPLVVPFLAIEFGWQWAFIVTGAVGFIWVFFWWAFYRTPDRHPRVSAAEKAYIFSDPPEPAAKIPWGRLLPHRQTWAFAVAKFMTDPIWWFYLFWLPLFLDTQHGITLRGLALPLIIIYVVADVGSIGGGYLSAAFMKRGWSLNRARKAAMLVCALCVVPTALTPWVDSVWTAVALVSLAAAAHQGWSANVFTLTSDMFPRRAVGSVVGIGGFAGAMGGVLFQTAVGFYLEYSGNNYVPVFLVCGLAYVSALFFVHRLVPNLTPAPVE